VGQPKFCRFNRSKKKEDFIGKTDPRIEHTQHDVEVMNSGKPLLNFHETIDIPIDDKGNVEKLKIVTQKGLLRNKHHRDEIIGITVNFSKEDINPMQYWIDKLRLIHIDIGGYFQESNKSSENVLNAFLPERYNGDRSFFSSNYYLLPFNETLALHKLNQGELWFHHHGSSFRLHIFPENGKYYFIDIGGDLESGESYNGFAPPNTWFGATIKGFGFGVASCCLAPGWDSRDTFVPNANELEDLKNKFPDQLEIIKSLVK